MPESDFVVEGGEASTRSLTPGKENTEHFVKPDMNMNKTNAMNTLALIIDQLLDAMKLALREATSSVRKQAEDVRQKIEQVLADTDRLVSRLESDEDKAVKQSS